MEDEYNKLSKEIEGYLRNLEKKIEDVIKVRGLIKEGNFENEKNNINLLRERQVDGLIVFPSVPNTVFPSFKKRLFAVSVTSSSVVV